MTPRFDQSKFMTRAKEGVQKELASPSHIIVQVVAAIDDLNKISNLMSERLNEWYGLHFPEFNHKDPVKYAKVARVLDRTNPDKDALQKLLPDNYTSILQKAKTSVGVKFSEEDMEMLRAHADSLLNLYKLKEDMEKYEDELAQKLCPNISTIAGAKVASQLIAHAGSLKKLAEMPASTIQVIGAEKALFKHLRSGSPPPKHGLIFQHPLISMAPKHARGKIARALAAKITIASKADAFTHNDISNLLKGQFEKRAADVLKKAKENPPKRTIRPSDSKHKVFAKKRFDGEDKPRGPRIFSPDDDSSRRASGGRRDSRDRGRGNRPSRPFRSRDSSDRPRGGRPFRSRRDSSDIPRDRPFRSRDSSDRPRGDGEKRFIRPDDSSRRSSGGRSRSHHNGSGRSGGNKFYHGAKKRSGRKRR